MEHIINCDASPFVPKGWEIEEHKKGGQFVFDPAKVRLHLSCNQQDDKIIKGHKLRKELANEPVFNANVLDYLLENPHLIPENWKKDEKGNDRYIYFWGTIYCDSDSHLFVRCLNFVNNRWEWNYRRLDFGWLNDDSAALRVS